MKYLGSNEPYTMSVCPSKLQIANQTIPSKTSPMSKTMLGSMRYFINPNSKLLKPFKMWRNRVQSCATIYLLKSNRRVQAHDELKDNLRCSVNNSNRLHYGTFLCLYISKPENRSARLLPHLQLKLIEQNNDHNSSIMLKDFFRFLSKFLVPLMLRYLQRSEDLYDKQIVSAWVRKTLTDNKENRKNSRHSAKL